MTTTQKHKSEPWLKQMEELFKACADQTRLRILNLLASSGEVCVCHLVDVLQTNQPKVSRHLAYLKRAGLVADRKDGLWVHYRLAAPLPPYAEKLLACLNSCCVEAPEMQRDVASLQTVQCGPPLVMMSSRTTVAKSVAPPVKQEAEAQPEIQIELL